MDDDELKVQVVHNRDKSRFEAEVEGKVALLDYVESPGRIVFTHTFTPVGLRGRGIASQVVYAGLEYARANNLSVVPQCWFVADYIDGQPEYEVLVKKG
ncbi:MAG: GNAT family N-acetyltransferase [Anaerolineae bacterium]